MDVFQAAYLVVICTAVYYYSKAKGKDKQKTICIVLGVVYFIIAAARHYRVGGDSFNYVRIFNNFRVMTFSQALEKISTDYGFYIPFWLISKMTSSYTVPFFLVALIFMSSLMRFVYKYSDNPILSWILILALSIYQFSLTAMRQTVAIAIILYAFDNYFEGRKKRSIVLSGFAALFHLSAITVTIALLLLLFIKKKRSFLIISPLVALVVLAFNKRIALILNPLLQKPGYDYIVDDGGGMTMTIVVLALYVFSVFFYFYSKQEDNLDTDMAFVAFVGLFFELLVPMQPIYFRLAFYFLPVLSVFLPRVLCKIQSGKLRIIMSMGVIIVMSLQYLLYTKDSCAILPYSPFWE